MLRLFALFILLALFTACASSDVSIMRVERNERDRVIGNFDSGEYGFALRTANYLNSRLLCKKAIEDPVEVIRYIEMEYQQDSQPKLLEYITDICSTQARNCNNSDKAAQFRLSAAIYAQRYMIHHLDSKLTSDDICDPGAFVVIRRYNSAITEIFEYLKSKNLAKKSGYQLISAMGETIYFKHPHFDIPFDPKYIHSIEACTSFQVKNLSHYSYWFGVGAPLIICAEQYETPSIGIKTYKNITYPATLFLRLRPRKNMRIYDASLEFISPYTSDTVRIARRSYPLEKDFSTPLAHMLAERDEINIFRYMLDPFKSESLEGLYCFDPYDPKKIPVVFVHGLLSSPKTWVQMINTLKNDKFIRDNYQFWFYTYSSGRPIVLSASHLRSSLDHCYATAAPDTAAFEKMIIVGHSMGGLISRLMISSNDSMRTFSCFMPEIDIQTMPLKGKNFMRTVLDFTPRPYINRVVFMATPHRGSQMAQWWITKWASNLISIPRELIELNKQLLESNETLYADLDRLCGFENGVENLDPESKFMRSIELAPMKRSIPIHSVIGNLSSDQVPDGTDGIVPYTSAHLDDVNSELVVKSGHSVQMYPLTILEMRRILHLHLKEHHLIEY